MYTSLSLYIYIYIHMYAHIHIFILGDHRQHRGVRGQADDRRRRRRQRRPLSGARKRPHMYFLFFVFSLMFDVFVLIHFSILNSFLTSRM